MLDQTVNNFGGRLKPKTDDTRNWANLVDLENKKTAFVYQRLSSHEQVKKSIYSIKAQDALGDLAKEDGYPKSLIYIEKRDLGISGSKGREDRPGLGHLIEQVEAGLVESVYVVQISRLYRDQTLINAFALGELFKEYDVILVTPQMRLNLKDKMHMRLFRMEAERAADELELMNYRLIGARDLKAKAGFWAGEPLPPGYIINECKESTNGERNPDYHTYQIHEPHAEIVKLIFEQLSIPGTTPSRIARKLKQQGVVFPYFPAELATKGNRRGFVTSKKATGGWPVTVKRIRNIATNPAYIGWKIWGGEIVGKDVYPPIIDEATFWTVQDRFDTHAKPKKDYDPMPLAGLLYCANHDTPWAMSYANRGADSIYQCYEHITLTGCTNIAAHILEGPISEAVIGQIALTDLADQVLNKLTNEYEQAKEQAASYRREMKRLEAEVNNLRTNLAASILSADQMQWIDEQIQGRLARMRELADLEKQPIGVIGKPAPQQADIDLVKTFLNDLGDNWDNQPNGLKNAFLRLLLDKVIIWHEPATIKVKIVWRVGLEQELLIYRPRTSTCVRWTKAELNIVKEHYQTASREEMLDLLPGRSWNSIRTRASKMGFGNLRAREPRRPYTPEEDEIVKRYFAGDISGDEAMELTGRTSDNLWNRGTRSLGLKWTLNTTRWEWLNGNCFSFEKSPSPGRRPHFESETLLDISTILAVAKILKNYE